MDIVTVAVAPPVCSDLEVPISVHGFDGGQGRRRLSSGAVAGTVAALVVVKVVVGCRRGRWLALLRQQQQQQQQIVLCPRPCPRPPESKTHRWPCIRHRRCRCRPLSSLSSRRNLLGTPRESGNTPEFCNLMHIHRQFCLR